MKDTLASFELYHLTKELQVLVGARVEKIFQQEKPQDDFLFSFHVPSQGKQYVYVSLPGILCLSSFKPSFPNLPPHFCASLRRKISNAWVEAVYQKAFERILVIDLSTKNGKASLIVELFSSGNIILVDETDTILAVLHPKIFNEERKVLPGRVYVFPQAQINPLELSKEEFTKLIRQSDRESLVKALAITMSLGGTYAEELIARTQLDKEVNPLNLTDNECKELYLALLEFLKEPTKVSCTQDACFPISLKLIESSSNDVSFSEAIANLALKGLKEEEKKSQEQELTKTLSKVDVIIKKQKNQLKGLETSAQENQLKGELLYTHYSELTQLLSQAKQASLSDLKNHPLIKTVDEKKRTLTVELSTP